MLKKFEFWEVFDEDGETFSLCLCEEGKFTNLFPKNKTPVLLTIFEARDADEATKMRDDYMQRGRSYRDNDNS